MRVLLSLAILLLLVGCAKAPVTGRSQLLLIDYEEEIALGLSASEEIKEESDFSTDRRLVERVRRIGKRIADVSGEGRFEWEFHVIEEDTLNAFCLPGGKVFFYTGILKVMKNDDQIAAVMGHEVAHALARHGGERLSMEMISDTGAEILAEALEIPEEYEEVYAGAYGIISNVGVLLPYSREHESEADQIGVLLMAKAGYNPYEAIRFWETMQATGGGESPEFLSTHPSDATRIKKIRTYIQQLEKGGMHFAG